MPISKRYPDADSLLSLRDPKLIFLFSPSTPSPFPLQRIDTALTAAATRAEETAVTLSVAQVEWEGAVLDIGRNLSIANATAAAALAEADAHWSAQLVDVNNTLSEGLEGAAAAAAAATHALQAALDAVGAAAVANHTALAAAVDDVATDLNGSIAGLNGSIAGLDADGESASAQVTASWDLYGF